MALIPLKLTSVSRSLFCILIIIQAFMLATYPVKYLGGDGFYGLAAVFVLSVCVGVGVLLGNKLIHWLWLVWLLYMVALVVAIIAIFGCIVIGNKFNEHSDIFADIGMENKSTSHTSCAIVGGKMTEQKSGSDNDTRYRCKITQSKSKEYFFGPNVLKIILSITPAEMLLLLNSVTGEAEVLKGLYFTATLNLFDGIEMLDVLLENDPETKATPRGMKIAVLVVVCLFFLFSFVELFQFKFDESETTAKPRKRVFRVNVGFQITLNVLFLLLRLVLWIAYKRDTAIFIAKNAISLVLLILPFLIERGWITTEQTILDFQVPVLINNH